MFNLTYYALFGSQSLDTDLEAFNAELSVRHLTASSLKVLTAVQIAVPSAKYDGMVSRLQQYSRQRVRYCRSS